MLHGGKRDGSGRPQGATNKVTQEAREKAESIGCKPLDVLLDMIKTELCSEQQDKQFGGQRTIDRRVCQDERLAPIVRHQRCRYDAGHPAKAQAPRPALV
jgi:hypothetical protein